MRNWPANFIAQLQSEGYRPYYLVFFNFDTPLRYTNCDIPLEYDGNLYNPRPLDVPEISYTIGSSVDSVSIEIDMADRNASLLDEFVGGTPGDVAAFVYMQVLNDDMQEIATISIFQGKIDAYSYSGGMLEVTVASFHSLWNKMSMEKSTASCRRNFKQPDCGYAGIEDWCDRSYSRCIDLDNTDRFNGFRFLPDLEDADIWWGQDAEYEEE